MCGGRSGIVLEGSTMYMYSAASRAVAAAAAAAAAATSSEQQATPVAAVTAVLFFFIFPKTPFCLNLLSGITVMRLRTCSAEDCLRFVLICLVLIDVLSPSR